VKAQDTIIVSLAVVGCKDLDVVLLQKLLEPGADVGREGHLAFCFQKLFGVRMWNAR